MRCGEELRTFNHDRLKGQVMRLHLSSSSTRNLVQITFADNFKASKSWSPWNVYGLSQKFIRLHLSKASAESEASLQSTRFGLFA